ncbi:hypothetical protein JYG23_11980 [Sedimentibacter sp. zth1]|uniref:hypothetical protein n=1 Tax=Sedimentibacter sp. zth1 TaxID=2816908 RepID=UPI001A937257|nr:hypothetical protein [Sedimentibacter sp. zth1]QSX05388.1 hypothetical protein JYG23_11980 [Sedimentibacter sp. zth1]
MYLVTYENDTKIDKVRDIQSLYEICRNMNVEALDELEENYTEDIEDMQTNRIKELLNVFTEGICVYKIKNVIKSVEECKIDEEEKAAILEVLRDNDIVRFNIDVFYNLSDILIDTEEEIF